MPSKNLKRKGVSNGKGFHEYPKDWKCKKCSNINFARR